MSSSLKSQQIIIGFLLFLSFIAIMSPLSTVKAIGEDEPQYGGWLTDCSYAAADIYNPVISADSASSYIEDFIFEGMVTYDKDMQIVPELALAWDISFNKLDYTFYLRQDVYWHDNAKFTADDIVFTWDRILDPRTQTTRASMFEPLDMNDVPYEKINDYTVVFHLKTTFAPMLNNMMFSIIPAHIFEIYSPAEGEGDYQFNDCPPNYAPIGTGCMMFDEWIRDNQTVLIRNSQTNGGPGYWRGHDAYLDGVIIRIVPEVTTQLLALKNGEIDKMDMSSTERSEIEAIQADENFVLYSAPQLTSDHITFNCDPSKGHHADTRDFTEEPNHFAGFEWQEPDPLKLPGSNIRKAFNYALDKELMISVAYPYGYRNMGPMYLGQNYWYNDEVNPYDVNITKANELLGEAGFGYTKDNPLRKLLNFMISYSTGGTRRQTTCSVAKGQWESALGVEVKVETIEWISMLNSHYDHRMFDAMSAGWTGGGGDPDLTNTWHSRSIMPDGQPTGFDPNTYVWEWSGNPTPGGLNYMGYWNPEVDNLMDIARMEHEKIVRKVYYDQIQEMIVDDSPYIWLLAHVTMEAVRSNIHGMIQGSVVGLWPQPIGFHNVWKSVSTEESSTTTIGQSTSGSSTTFGGVAGDSSSYVPYLLPMLIIGGFFVVGGVIGTFLRKR